MPVPVTFAQPLETRNLNFRRADYALMSTLLSEVNWDSLIEASRSIDHAVDSFRNAVVNIIEQIVPVCAPPRKPPWSNARLRTLKRQRSAALRKYSCYRSPYYRNEFRTASKNYRSLNRSLYNRYVLRTQSKLRRNPKQFWSFVNTKRKEIGLPSSMFLGDSEANDESEKCSLFAEQFKLVFNHFVASSGQVEEACTALPRDVVSFRLPSIDADTVSAALGKLKSSYTVGPDGIPACVLKQCSTVLCSPIAKLLTLSMQQCKFPDQWKYSYLFPVHKKGDKRDVSNYRGITSMCACSKLLEIIVNDILIVACKHYIDEDQHGFFPKRSVTSNLLQFVSRCVQSLDSGLQMDAVYLDLKAAFDRVDHNILLGKMEKLGLSSDATRWLRSYLVDRKVCVKIGSTVSECFTNLSGVPQGSNLGPLLFIIFINDVSLLLPPGCRLFYADDSKLYKVIRCLQDCTVLQECLNLFADWCSRNCLTLSIDKCNIITFHRKLRPIEFDYTVSTQSLTRVQTVKDLGVLLDKELTFRNQYESMIAKANRQLGFIFKIADEFRDPLCLKSLYCSLVRSILETNSVIWCPYHANWSYRIEKIQKKFLRYALRHLTWDDPVNLPPYEDRCRLIGIQSLEHRRVVAQAVFVAKLLTGRIDSPPLLAQVNLYAPERQLRRRNFLYLEPRNRQFGSNDPMRVICQRFNSMFELFDFDISIDVFRQRIVDKLRRN